MYCSVEFYCFLFVVRLIGHFWEKVEIQRVIFPIFDIQIEDQL